MERTRTKGTKQFNVEVDAELLDEFRGWLQARGEKARTHIEMAMRRHMDNPPPPIRPVAPPLPPLTAPEPVKPAPKGKRKK